MGQVLVSVTRLPNDGLVVDYEWGGDRTLRVARALLGATDAWHGPRSPFPGSRGQLGPFHLRCTGYDAQRREYVFEREDL